MNDHHLRAGGITETPSFNPWNGRPYSQKYYDLLEKRKKLPVWRYRDEFVKELMSNRVVIVAGAVGSGKSTQIPQFVLEAVALENEYIISCTQPRKVKTVSVSHRVADEMDVNIGEEVGYSVCFEDCSSSLTVLKYLTDGMLLREAMTDPLLKKYKVIILDEAQERTLATDVLFGHLRELLEKRIDLKIVVMTAIFEAAKFQDYFYGASLMTVPGPHCVEIYYTRDPERNYFEAAIRTVLQIHSTEPPGDILLFLTSKEEVEEACSKLTREIGTLVDHVGPLKVVPLNSTLPPLMQQKVYEPSPPPLTENGLAGRKIVLATNNTVNSVIKDGIVYVIDPGFSKQKVYDPLVRVESLFVSPISKSSTHQRAGFAGIAHPGKCFRLYTERSFHDDLQPHTYPKILRSNLTKTVLTLIKLGIDKLGHYDFMDVPAPMSFIRGLEVLNYIGALDDNGALTKLGEIISEFPLDPEMAKMLVMSPKFNCSNEILSISAMLSVPNCFVRPREAQNAADDAKARFRHIDGDHLTLLNVYRAYKQNNEDESWCNENFVNHWALKSADNVRQQLARIMAMFHLKLSSTDFNSPDYAVNLRRAILSGYFMQVAHLDSTGIYRTVKDNQRNISSIWLVAPDSPVLRLVVNMHTTPYAIIRSPELVDTAPDYYDLQYIPQSSAKCALEVLYTSRELGRCCIQDES
ncbi:hypothetical protein AgCh_036114 [Apium graveolens]